MVFNTTFNNISVIPWRSVLFVEETRVPGENHRPVATNHWQTLSHTVVSSIPRHKQDSNSLIAHVFWSRTRRLVNNRYKIGASAEIQLRMNVIHYWMTQMENYRLLFLAWIDVLINWYVDTQGLGASEKKKKKKYYIILQGGELTCSHFFKSSC
jgi:hypothetical protein